MLLLILSVEFWLTGNDRKRCWSGHASIIYLIFVQLCLLHFPFNVSFGSFLLQADCSFLKIMNFVCHIGLRVLIDQMWQRFFNFELSWLSNSTFLKITFLNSSIKVWIGGDIFLNASEMAQILTISPLTLECWWTDLANNVLTMSIFKQINL